MRNLYIFFSFYFSFSDEKPFVVKEEPNMDSGDESDDYFLADAGE